MTDWITPDTMWQDRVGELEQDFERIKALLDSNLDGWTPGLGGSFRQTLSDLQVGVRHLKQCKISDEPRQCWKALAKASGKCQTAAALELELLTGAALRSAKSEKGEKFNRGFINRSETWLHQLHQRVNVRTMPIVIPGRGPLLRLESELGRDIVRVPFPDWDLWHLPLLGQATGMLAVDKDHSKNFTPVIDQLLPNMAAFFQGEPTAQRIYLRHLCADMFATAILGPVYALALFVLELDYGSSQQRGLEDPDEVEWGLEDPDEVEETAANRRILPAPVERAATVLAMLEYMTGEAPGSPYQSILNELKSLCQAILASVGYPDLLETTRQHLRPSHELIFNQAVRNLVDIDFPKIRETWQRAEHWRNYFSAKAASAPDIPPRYQEGEWLTTELVSAIWLYRTQYPAYSSEVLEMAEDILAGDTDVIPYSDKASKLLPSGVVEARLQRLKDRWMGYKKLFQDEKWVKAADQIAVSGRIYQMLSQQLYLIDECRKRLQGEDMPVGIWTYLTDLEDKARPVQREALEVLGGLRVIYNKLDSDEPEVGPHVSVLADRLLKDRARRSGVNWDARTILGRDAFLAPDTNVIRLRFPDWSL